MTRSGFRAPRWGRAQSRDKFPLEPARRSPGGGPAARCLREGAGGQDLPAVGTGHNHRPPDDATTSLGTHAGHPQATTGGAPVAQDAPCYPPAGASGAPSRSGAAQPWGPGVCLASKGRCCSMGTGHKPPRRRGLPPAAGVLGAQPRGPGPWFSCWKGGLPMLFRVVATPNLGPRRAHHRRRALQASGRPTAAFRVRVGFGGCLRVYGWPGTARSAGPLPPPPFSAAAPPHPLRWSAIPAPPRGRAGMNRCFTPRRRSRPVPRPVATGHYPRRRDPSAISRSLRHSAPGATLACRALAGSRSASTAINSQA